MICPRCNQELQREHFDIYICLRCGRVELFVDGIGEEFRPH